MSTRQEEGAAESAGAGSQRVRPWASLTIGQYRLLWSSGVLSVVAEQGRRTVDLALIHQLSGGSALQLGTLGLFQAIPLFTAGFFAGTLLDMFDRKRLIQLAQALRVALILILTALVVTDLVQVWHVYLITLVTGFAQVVDQPGRASLVASVVPRHYLMNGIALNSATRQLGLLIGPVIAGFLILPIGYGGTYLTLAGIYVASNVILLFFTVRTAPEGRGKSIKWRDVTEGLTFVARTRFVAGVLSLDALMTLFTNYRVLMPIFAIDILGGDQATLGLLLSAPAAGRLVGTTLLLSVGNISRQGLIVLSVTMAYAVAIALFSQSTVLWLSWLLVAIVGGTDGAGGIVRSSVVQLVVPDEIRGRVTTVAQVEAQGSSAVAQLTTGALAAAIGAPGALLAGAVFTAAVVVFMGVRVKEMLSFRI